MANKRISELDEAAKLQDKDLLVIVQDSMTKKITILNAKELLKGKDGINGKDGKDGAPGPVNTITIGTVTKGEEASATLTGTPPNQVLNLVLPKGENGEQGETGEKGAQGEPGVPGKDGEDGINGISILSVEVGNIFQEDNYTITQLIINKSDGSQEVVNVKSKNGVDGKDGTSVLCVKVNNEEEAMQQSTTDPNNIYYW